jgi:cation:H+ antiporter
MLLTVLILIASLLVLTVGAEALVRGSVRIAKRLGLSSFFIGLTLVGFGTSTPELGAALTAALKGQGDIAVGNVVGSNILNICIILGLTAILNPIPVRIRVVRREAILVIAVAMVPWAVHINDRTVNRWEGILLFALLIAYIGRGYFIARSDQSPEAIAAQQELEEEVHAQEKGWFGSPLGAAALVLIGLGMLAGGAYFLVESASSIARSLGISELVIGLTVVAGGTSAPELVTSLVAAYRKQSDISVGNILGSNMFNMLGILGITAAVQPQAIPWQTIVLDTPMMALASLALLPIVFSRSCISRKEGVLLVGAYAIYAYLLFAYVPAWFGP